MAQPDRDDNRLLENGSIDKKKESSTPVLPEATCSDPSLSPGMPEGLHRIQLSPRCTRAIIAANLRIPRNTNAGKLGITSEVDLEEYNHDPRYSQVIRDFQQNTFSPQTNIGYYSPARQGITQPDTKGPSEQANSRSIFPTKDGLFPPSVSHQDQFPIENVNQFFPPTHAFGARSCPYCNSQLPPEPVYQRQPTSNQNRQLVNNQFNLLQQYPMLQGVGYQNINPIVKTSPTLPSEEMCPYDSSPQEVLPISPSLVYNQTLHEAAEVRSTPGGDSLPPAHQAINSLQGRGTPKNMIKTGFLSEHSLKYDNTKN